jgi:protein-L-isoaspartate(D-aspartate) O-methyltransferase
MEPDRSCERKGPRSDPNPLALRTALVDTLRAAGVFQDAEVERALRTVPRHLFLPNVSLSEAYADIAVPTRWQNGVAISSASQPAIVAIMLEQLQVRPGMRVLEIGAGVGYNAALLAELVSPSGSVTTLDIDHDIVDEAAAHLEAAGYEWVRALTADGGFGWPAGAPYDRVILTVGASDITPAWFDQLVDGGVLVLPLWLGGGQASVAFRKRDGILTGESVAPCGFMRLRGQEASAERVVRLPDGRQLFAEHAEVIADAVGRLLRTRPRRRLWTRPPQPYLQRLGVSGHRIISVFTQRQGRKSLRTRVRQGVFVVGPDGPSLAIFANTQPLVLYFGGEAAERALKQLAVDTSPAAETPMEQWRIVAYPIASVPAMVPRGALRVVRRHFTYDIWLDLGNAQTGA